MERNVKRTKLKCCKVQRHAIEIFLFNEPRNWRDIDNENTPVDTTETLNIASSHEQFQYDRREKKRTNNKKKSEREK